MRCEGINTPMSAQKNNFTRQGEKIYHQKILRFQGRYHKGEYAAIDVRTGRFFVAPRPVQAIEKAEKALPHRKYYLVRIGYTAAASLKTLSS